MVGIIITVRVSLKGMCNNRVDEKRICKRAAGNKGSSDTQMRLLIRNLFEKQLYEKIQKFSALKKKKRNRIHHF
jgi:hypothetical protein